MDRIHTERNLGPVFTAIDIAVFALSTFCVLVRVLTRSFITRNPGWDDATIILAQVNLSVVNYRSHV